MPEIIFFTALFLLLHSYIFYPVISWVVGVLFGKKYRKDFTYQPTVSVLTAAYNEEKVIGTTLQALLASDYPMEKLEIIVGDDKSKDNTDEIVQQVASEHPNVKLFTSEGRKGKSGIMNRISEMASGEIFVLCDSNMVFDKGAVKNLVANFADKRIGGVSGEILLRETIAANQETSYWSFESWLKYQEGRIGRLIGANGGIYAIRKEHYFRYPEGQPLNDDFVTAMKILGKGKEFVYDPAATAHEDPTPTNEDEFRRKKRILMYNLGSLKLLGEFFLPFKPYISFAFWSHKIIRWMTPLLLLIMLVSSFFLLEVMNYFLVIDLVILLTFLLAFLGWFSSRGKKKIRALLLFYYFYGTIIALMSGTFSFIFTKTGTTWEPPKR
ncbi:MAG: glycosyltransferase family 2 protein [Ignavibacteria bacterium]|nr:glycosyltransferase family 2 protein [Ignavibacteria bacterium]